MKMKKHKNRFILLALLILLLYQNIEITGATVFHPINATNFTTTNSIAKKNTKNLQDITKSAVIEPKKSNLVLIEHEPIYIESDSDLEAYNFSGDGTLLNPYRIENYNITTTESSGIYISATTKYIVIVNCYINTSVDGIFIRKTTKDTISIINTTIIGGETGVSILDTVVTIDNVTCINNRDGIKVWSDSYANITNSLLVNNTYVGIYVFGYVNISNTICIGSGESGIEYISGSGRIENSTISSSNQEGIYLSNSIVTIINTTIEKNRLGIAVRSQTSATIYNSLCIDNFLSGIDILDTDHVEIVNVSCIGNGYEGIGVQNATTTIINSTASQNMCGIVAYGDSIVTVINSNLITNRQAGIRATYENSLAIIVNCTCNQNAWDGISAENNATIISINNTCNNNELEGIGIFESTGIILNNTVQGNNQFGIRVSNSRFVRIYATTFKENSMDGVYLYNSLYNLIVGNIIENNTGYGINIDTNSNNTVIYWNYLGNNSVQLHAKDDGNSNVWYNSTLKIGNYWENWNTTANYTIEGMANSEDLYPMDAWFYDDEKPIINNISYNSTELNINNVIAISANVSDNIGIAVVMLHYSIENIHHITLMNIDSDGYYAKIGPYPEGTIVDYYIEVIDFLGNIAVSPHYSLKVIDTVAPSINEILYSPHNPTENDKIVINAVVEDNIAVENVTTYYKIDEGSWQTAEMTYSDSGYKCTIGPFTASSIVNFYVNATDTTGNWITSDIYSLLISDVSKPIISNVSYIPDPPVEHEPIEIRTIVTDNVEVDKVTLSYSINEGQWITIEMTKDNDLNSLYKITIGPFTAEDKINFYITAADTSGNTALSSIISFVITSSQQNSTTVPTPISTITLSSSISLWYTLTSFAVMALIIKLRFVKRKP